MITKILLDSRHFGSRICLCHPSNNISHSTLMGVTALFYSMIFCSARMMEPTIEEGEDAAMKAAFKEAEKYIS